MDVLFDAFPLLLFVAYMVLRRLMRAGQTRTGATPSGGDDATTPEPLDLEALMRALGAEPTPPALSTPVEPMPAAEVPPARPSGATLLSADTPTRARAEEASFVRERYFDEGHFHDGDRFYDDVAAPDAAAPRLTHSPIPTAALPRRRRGRLAARLRTPEAARDAFVLQTIFGPRGGRNSTR